MNSTIHNAEIADQQVAALIAAAGMSRRMGQAKQLMAWQGKTVLETIIEKLVAAAAQPICCVIGHQQEKIRRLLSAQSLETVYNPNYATAEMLSSFQAGLRHLDQSSSGSSTIIGSLIVLGDQPQIPTSIMRRVISRARHFPEQLIIPSYEMRRGHPFYLPRRLWPELLSLGGQDSLRTLLAAHSSEIRYIEVHTPAILLDMDTPQDYHKLQHGMANL